MSIDIHAIGLFSLRSHVSKRNITFAQRMAVFVFQKLKGPAKIKGARVELKANGAKVSDPIFLQR